MSHVYKTMVFNIHILGYITENEWMQGMRELG